MTEPRFLQIHTLQSYPAVLLNRDDAGLAKRLPFGGATRTRISSQCLKRHWRKAEDEFSLTKINAVAFGKRSRLIFSRALVTDLVRERGYDENDVRAVAALLKERMFSKDDDKKKNTTSAQKGDPLDTEQAFLLGDPEIAYLRSLVQRVLDGDKELEAAISEKPKKKDQKTEFQKKLRDNLKELAQSAKVPFGLEAALFGRMVTSDLVANTDAAIYVAHAFTVHAEESESDYFTVVDDLKDRASGDDAGSAGIFDAELTSGLFYGYVVIDVPALVSNLEGCKAAGWLEEGADRSLAGKVVEHLCHLIAKVSPGAKLGSTAPFAWARLMLIEAGSRQPRSLANAFRGPVRLAGGVEHEALAHLGAEIAKLDAAYGTGEARRFTSVEEVALPAAERLPLDELAAWAAEVVRAGRA